MRITATRYAHVALALLLLGSFSTEGCTTSPPAPSPVPSAAASTVAPATPVPTLLPSGIRITDLKPGSGPPNFETATHARVNLVMRAGDKAVETRESLLFKIGGKLDYPGLVEGMRGMQLGGTRRIEVPAKLAFGAKGKPPAIPADSPIVYEVHISELRLPPYYQPSGAPGAGIPTGIPIVVPPRSGEAPSPLAPGPR